ncbi:helix-turn-helix transcriptional regulator [Sulfurimonas sp.]|uniref:helix-turn-helix transcriptional regulator n=1 Tax=Sulfurimonas sp. TaxID=2022749 RepID=UPI002B4660D9|nr:LuxR C-terminal-related transcriptional regulator [Sulfurimonas sp.]
MHIILFSSDLNIIDEWKKKSNTIPLIFDNINSLMNMIKELGLKKFILIADYNSVATGINKFISSNTLPEKVIILERVPEITTGKMLISHGIKAYGNSKMLKHHYRQMLEVVENEKIWTYPELTVSLAKRNNNNKLSDEANKLLQNRLTKKEIETIYHILKGLTNDAIANIMSITPRTVKAHTSAIFSKLHVNDKVSLVLLLNN